MSNTLTKAELIKHFTSEKEKWVDMIGQPQDVVHDKFIEDVLIVLGWVLSDIHDM